MAELVNGVKLGTCEDLYFTTFNQLKGWRIGDRGKNHYLKLDSGYRFRFPFPDEIGTQIGHYDEFDRGYMIELPKGMLKCSHGEVFIRTDSNLKCAGSPMGFRVKCPTLQEKVYKWSNHNTESFEIVQQKYVMDEVLKRPMLHTVFRCPYCGVRFRADMDEIQAISEYLSDEGKKRQNPELMEIAIIMLRGYTEAN